jgi:hypothetical protein
LGLQIFPNGIIDEFTQGYFFVIGELADLVEQL